MASTGMSILKAVGVFWDIENCCVPKGKSALKIIERIRERYFTDCREAEFICVCDINKEADTTIKDLNDGQINVVHINATAKNAADDKIRQSMRRFADSHPPGTKVILISSDVNFASDLSDLRHRKKFEVVLIHKTQVSEALLSCSTEHFLWEDLIKDLPLSAGQKENADTVCIVYGYDSNAVTERVSAILKMLSSNCGGKVISIGHLYAVLKFSTSELMESIFNPTPAPSHYIGFDLRSLPVRQATYLALNIPPASRAEPIYWLQSSPYF
ncbi:meiosis arrest female protein 1 homolog [Elysia marginata]|uniref:Meiosis arrest female protein 1 homolog n=1 Tax=Elysia marginata TaxID=1093978 RepID=A0AAV4H1A0_9GAST|nr:meiosis arrest female protein 1 homolog [Elysia marginata]